LSGKDSSSPDPCVHMNLPAGRVNSPPWGEGF
jgi:hypothetical protein